MVSTKSKYIFPDYETYSALDIKKVSTDRYASHPSTRVLMCAFAFDSGPVELWQEGDSAASLEALKRDLRSHIVVPWHTSFERAISKYVWKMDGLTWDDAMVHALYAGLPAGLKDCNRVPYFANESKTSKESLLINKFCKPQKDGGVRNRETDPEDWQAFCDYCKADVFDTRLIFQWIQTRFTMPDRVYRGWLIDQKMNTRGMPVDRLLTYRAQENAERLQIENYDELKRLTGLDNPNSPAQLLGWLQERGYPFGGIGKELLKKALNEDPDPEDKNINDDDE
jgi:DNA polymerase bacteriophage-type